MVKSISVYDIIHFTLVLFQGYEVGLTVGVLWSAGSNPASGDDTPVKLRFCTVRLHICTGTVPYRNMYQYESVCISMYQSVHHVTMPIQP